MGRPMEWASHVANNLEWIEGETYIGKQAGEHAVDVMACGCDLGEQ